MCCSNQPTLRKCDVSYISALKKDGIHTLMFGRHDKPPLFLSLRDYIKWVPDDDHVDSYVIVAELDENFQTIFTITGTNSMLTYITNLFKGVEKM